MNQAFNCITTIFTHLYSITGYVAIIFMFAPLHMISHIPTPLEYFQLSTDAYTHYICSRYECETNNIYNEQNTWEYLATYILFHLLAATVIPFTSKYIADYIANYIVQRITNLFTHINITSFPHQHLQLEDIQDQHDFNTEYEYMPITFFPNHMSGHLQPVRQQQQSFGRLVSHQYTHTHNTHNTHRIIPNTHNTIGTRLIDMSILERLFANTNHIDTDTNTDSETQKSTGLPTRIDTAYIHTVMKTFAGDACPICITKFHILEINNKTLAATMPCKHLFCHACIEKYVNNRSMTQVPCPLCRDILEELYINK